MIDLLLFQHLSKNRHEDLTSDSPYNYLSINNNKTIAQHTAIDIHNFTAVQAK